MGAQHGGGVRAAGRLEPDGWAPGLRGRLDHGWGQLSRAGTYRRSGQLATHIDFGLASPQLLVEDRTQLLGVADHDLVSYRLRAHPEEDTRRWQPQRRLVAKEPADWEAGWARYGERHNGGASTAGRAAGGAGPTGHTGAAPDTHQGAPDTVREAAPEGGVESAPCQAGSRPAAGPRLRHRGGLPQRQGGGRGAARP